MLLASLVSLALSVIRLLLGCFTFAPMKQQLRCSCFAGFHRVNFLLFTFAFYLVSHLLAILFATHMQAHNPAHKVFARVIDCHSVVFVFSSLTPILTLSFFHNSSFIFPLALSPILLHRLCPAFAYYSWQAGPMDTGRSIASRIQFGST